MKSPFPGMDPYLERYWSNVHFNLLSAIQRQLQLVLPDGLRARAEEAVVLEHGSENTFRPDVVVTERFSRSDKAVSSTRASGAVLMPSFEVELERETHYERWVQIVDLRDARRVITVIEVLSPSNKGAGRANDEYLRKLDRYERAGVSVVEIDLLRSPPRTRLPVGPLGGVGAGSPYVACVRRAWKPMTWEVFPLPLRSRLGSIPVPMRESDAEVPLDLQSMIDTAYAEGGYGDDLDYSKPPDPPLEADDTAWAAELLKGQTHKS